MREFDPTQYATAFVDLALPDGMMRLAPANEPGSGFPFGGPVHIVSGANPGHPLTPDENAARRVELLAAIEQLRTPTIAAVGRDAVSDYFEDSIVLVGVSDEDALALGRRFGQDAIFRWSPGSFAIIDCTTGAVTDRGWALTPCSDI